MGGAGGNEIKYQCEVISVDSAFTRIQGCLLHTHYFIYMLKEKNGGRETVGSWDGTGAVGGGGRGGRGRGGLQLQYKAITMDVFRGQIYRSNKSPHVL